MPCSFDTIKSVGLQFQCLTTLPRGLTIMLTVRHPMRATAERCGTNHALEVNEDMISYPRYLITCMLYTITIYTIIAMHTTTAILHAVTLLSHCIASHPIATKM